MRPCYYYGNIIKMRLEGIHLITEKSNAHFKLDFNLQRNSLINFAIFGTELRLTAERLP